MPDDRGEGSSGSRLAEGQSTPPPAVPVVGHGGDVVAREDGKGKARDEGVGSTGRSDREHSTRNTQLPNDMLEAMRELRFPAAAQPEISACLAGAAQSRS